MQSAGVVGLGLTTGASLATSREDEDDGGVTEAADGADHCATETAPGEFKLQPEDLEAADGAGFSVSVSGDTALVGTMNEQRSAPSIGSAYVYTDDGEAWCLQAKLVPDGAEPNEQWHEDRPDDDLFGAAVSLDGDTALVGAQNDDDTANNSGAAYVFTRRGDAWSQEAKLLADDGDTHDLFGGSVSVSGDTALVGAHLEDDSGFQGGAAYVFTRNGGAWSQETKLLADGGDDVDAFGAAVSLDGDTALVGAPSESRAELDVGAAYVFTYSGSSWTQEAKLVADDAERSDHFGREVDLDGDTALLGAESKDEAGRASGAAYVFTRNGSTWSQQAKLRPDDGQELDRFGFSVGVDGDRAVVGTFNPIQGATGKAYLFTRDEASWSQAATIVPADGAVSDRFGWSAGVHRDRALVGAFGSDDTGAAYLFDFTEWEPTDPDDEDPNGDPTQIDSCTVISEPGEYDLVADLAPTEMDEPACIVIDSDGVTLRGNGHTIDASDATFATPEASANYERPVCIAVHPYTNGLEEDDWDTVVEDVIVTGGSAGVAARFSSGGRYTDVTAVDNDDGFLFETDGGLLRNCVVEDNDRGVAVDVSYTGGSFFADLEDCTLRGNGIGLSVDQEMSASVVRTRIVENDIGVFAVPFPLDPDRGVPTRITIEGCHVCRNRDYGVHADTDPLVDADGDATPRDGSVVALDNYWGAANGPSSHGDPEEPYVDPETGRPADGDGDAVSESLEPGVSNVRFDPFRESTIDGVGADR